MTGKVVHGRENGRKIGFPTINVAAIDYVLPKNGVYGAKAVSYTHLDVYKRQVKQRLKRARTKLKIELEAES